MFAFFLNGHLSASYTSCCDDTAYTIQPKRALAATFDIAPPAAYESIPRSINWKPETGKCKLLISPSSSFTNKRLERDLR